MRAFQIGSSGAAPALVTLPLPNPGPGEVRLRIAACGLNFADLLMIDGKYQERPAPPYTLGMELAGTVDALGSGVSAPALGARVAVFAGHGGLAEAGCFDASRCLALPATMSFAEAAAFQIAYGTSHLALSHRARLQPGERLLVLGAAGGVGLSAVEIGKAMGAQVIAVARGAARLAVAEVAGATHLLDSEAGGLKAAVRALGGADVVYDAVGGDLARAALAATNPGGRYLLIGFASGQVPDFPANHLLVKNIALHGFFWGGYQRLAPELAAFSLQTLFQWHAKGHLRPHIGASLPLSRAAEALALLRDRASTGKVVVTMSD
ncbi:MAG: NADPH:quinone oxidoreductase family protein [Phaeovulum sp.]|uniref:NADPH:quinone oxidoreductase family protein n=1 Tax=Phaeovulum sp. TaxID=2934796 RepID=UPI00272FB919|nr:NADPH:quinone oxidoreductase family protein [Phaeovulum sp.]MDP2062544.1 NADPH:quinone oxidoreductase family protein [Phaeovulum sp.]